MPGGMYMSKAYSLAISDFIKRKGMSIITEDESVLDDPESYFCISLDQDMDIFITLQNNNTIVLFTFTAELKQLNMRQAFGLTLEALTLNNFKWRSPVQFFLDEDKTRLISWCSLPLANGEVDKIETKFDALARVNKKLRKSFNINDSLYRGEFCA
jgi:hypothetical protein